MTLIESMSSEGARSLRIRLNGPQMLCRRAMRPRTSLCTGWGRGVGKSWWLRQSDYLTVAEYDGKMRPGANRPGVRIVLVMPTLTQARKVHEADLMWELEGPWSFLGGKLDRAAWRVNFPGGSWIQWVTGERAKHTRGIRCDKINFDEADDIPLETFDAIGAPWLSEPWSLGIRLVSGTPTRGRAGLLYRQHKRGLDGVDNHWSLHATGYDVPNQVSRHVLDEERANAERDGRLDVYKREWLCDYDSAEGLVYPSFHQDFHVRENDERTVWTDMLVGVDHGFAAPGVFLLVGVAGRGDDAVCHVLDEVYEADKTESWWCDKAAEWHAWYPNARWFGDPAWPGRIEAIRKRGPRIVGADNGVEDGLSEVAKRLAITETIEGDERSRLYVHPRCKQTIAEFGSYRRKRDPRARDTPLEVVDKRNDHAMDSLRYALRSHFGAESRGRNSAGMDRRQR